jgi:putative ABC transport system ATP-binding protein
MFMLENVQYGSILQIHKMVVESHQVTCIVGESGAGKSTLLKLLNKMVIPDSGDIYYKGELLQDRDPINHRREVVMLPQTPLIFPGTIAENLQLGRLFSEKEAAAQDELKRVLDICCLSKSVDEDAEDLSGGEKQRLALARVLLMKPSVYLLDEPSSALDEQTEKTVIEQFIKEVQKQEGTIVMVTHSNNLASEYGDHVITIKKKKV